jgi:hypothetical protein
MEQNNMRDEENNQDIVEEEVHYDEIPTSTSGDKSGRLTHRAPVANQVKQSMASKAYDRDNKGYLDATEKIVRGYDKDGNGKIEIEEVFNIVKDLQKQEKKRQNLKKLLGISLLVMLVVLTASFGLTWAVVIISRQIEPNARSELVNKDTGEIVSTKSVGLSILEVTPDAAYIGTVRRHLLGTPTDEDRRLQASDSLVLIGTAAKEPLKKAYIAIMDSTPVKITVPAGPITYTRPVNAVDIALLRDSESVDVYTGLRLEGHAEPWFQIHCRSDEEICQAYSEGYFDPSTLAHSPNSTATRRKLFGFGSCYDSTDCDMYKQEPYSWECVYCGDDEERKIQPPEEGRCYSYDDCQCFSAVATANVEGKGSIAMEDLRVGDRVLTKGGKYNTIYTFDHFHHTKPTSFLQIYTDSTEQDGPIELTGNHLIFLEGKANPVPAKQIESGDYVSTPQGPARVTQITTITRNGLYSPLTTDGSIVINNMIASTYSSPVGTEYIEINGFQVIAVQKFIHMATAPIRAVCMGLPLQLCDRAHGEYSVYGQVGHVLLSVWKNSPAVIQSAVAAIILLLVGLWSVLLHPVVLCGICLSGVMSLLGRSPKS